MLSRIYVRYASAPPSRDQLNGYAASIDAAIEAHLLPLCSPQVKTAEVMVTDLTSEYGARGIATSARVGTRSGLPNGAGVAALINFRVARRYRGGKPRVYIPLFVSDDLTERLTWSQDALDAGTAWAAFIDRVLNGMPPALRVTGQVNVSYYEGLQGRDRPADRPVSERLARTARRTGHRRDHRLFGQPEARQSAAAQSARAQAAAG